MRNKLHNCTLISFLLASALAGTQGSQLDDKQPPALIEALRTNQTIPAFHSDLKDPIFELRDYWQNPFNIEYVRFSRDPSYYRNNGTNVTCMVEHEASAHPGTFYISQLTDIRNSGIPRSKAEVTGASQKDYWVVYGVEVAIADKQRAISGTNTHPEVSAAGMWRTFEDTMNIGINGLEKGSMQWENQTSFVAQSVSSGIIHGQLLLTNDFRISGLIYSYDGISNMSCHVDYTYGGIMVPTWMPTQVVMNYHWNRNNKEMRNSCTNVIHECRIGTNLYNREGFLPGQFVTNLAWSNLVIVYYSNNMAYAVRNGKIMRTVDVSKTGWTVHPSNYKWVRLSFFIVVASILSAFSWHVVHSREKHKQNQ